MDYRISQKELNALADAAGMLNVLRISAVSVVSLEIYEPEDVAKQSLALQISVQGELS